MKTVTLRFLKGKVTKLPVVCCCCLFKAYIYKFNANYMVVYFLTLISAVECKMIVS